MSKILSFQLVINTKKILMGCLHSFVCATSLKSVAYFILGAYLSSDKPHFKCSKAQVADGFHTGEQSFII